MKNSIYKTYWTLFQISILLETDESQYRAAKVGRGVIIRHKSYMIKKKEATRVWHDPGELCDPTEMLVEYAQALKEYPCMLLFLFQWALWLRSDIEQKECQVALHTLQGSPHSDTTQWWC